MSTPKFKVIYDRPGEYVYGELGLNLYTNCSHKCKYCYNKVSDRQQGPYDEPAKGATPSNIEHDLQILRREHNRRPVWLSALCDPYDLGREAPSKPKGLFQYDKQKEAKPVGNGYTRAVLERFRFYDQPFSVLTKGGMLAAKDFDLYGPNDKFGCTLTFDNDVHSNQYEPGAALRTAHSRGIQTTASIDPVIYPHQSLHLIEMTHEFVDFYFLEPLSWFPKEAAKIDWPKFRVDAEALLQSLGKQPERDYRFLPGHDRRDVEDF